MDAAPSHGPNRIRLRAAYSPPSARGCCDWSPNAPGARPYFVPVEHTAQARAITGPDAFLGVEQAVVLDTDLARAREVATAHVAGYVAVAPHQQANVRRGPP